MDLLLLHPRLVHLPIALSVVVPLVATGTLIAWWRGFFDRRTWLLVVALQLLLLIGGLAAFQTGENDEEQVERVVAERYIEEHEEAAEVFVWAGGIVLALMLFAAFVPAEPVALRAAVVATLGAFIVLALGYRTGDAGGKLVYQYGAADAFRSVPFSAAAGEGRERLDPALVLRRHDDDDDD